MISLFYFEALLALQLVAVIRARGILCRLGTASLVERKKTFEQM